MNGYDAIIIGFGKGGKTLAGDLAAAGKRVALVEQSDKMYGGTCINIGCIPSKSLKTSAEKSAILGGSFEEKAIRYRLAVAERERVTSMLRDKNYHRLVDHPLIDVINGCAVFTGMNSVLVNFYDGSLKELHAALIFINTGSIPRLPSIVGAGDSRYVYNSETLMKRPELPKRLVVIGGGYIGMEFASMYANFGAAVTVLQDGERFLPREDEEISAEVLKRLKEMGVDVRFSAKTRAITDKNGFTALSVETPEGMRAWEAEAVLLATGRIPNTAALHLEAAGVNVTEHGGVKTDEHLCTSNPAIYAMGDVIGGLQFTYISLDDYRIVKSAVLSDGSRTTKNRGAVPYSVFLDPPFSRVGLSEKEAREQGYEAAIVRLSAAAIPKAQVTGDTSGLLKAVIDKTNGRILGAHLFCAESHEIINIIKMAMDAGLPYTSLRDGIFTHPTMAESLNDLFATFT